MQRRNRSAAKASDHGDGLLVDSDSRQSNQHRNRSDPPGFASIGAPKAKPVLARKKSKPRNIFDELGTSKRLNLNDLAKSVHDFFHARTGVEGCRLVGIIRVCYACCYLYTVILMTIQMPILFDPRKGLLPYSITGEIAFDYDYTIFEYAPQSSVLMHLVFLIGLSSGFLVLLGYQPRWGAFGCFFFLNSLQFHSKQIFDAEWRMDKIWSFFLMLLPLDHITIYDGFGGLVPLVRRYLNLPPPQRRQAHRTGTRTLSSSWPMWPFRLWQIYTCMIYMGAGICKLNSRPWINGNALSWIWYDESVGRLYPAFVNEFMFNRLINIKLQTWLSLAVENLSYITIWPQKTRKITFVAIVFLHIGIELSMVMHIFEYLSVLGWVCFFVYPENGESNILIQNKKNGKPKWSAAAAFGSNRRKIIETVVAVSLLYLLIYDAFPIDEVERLMPAPLLYLVSTLVYPTDFTNDKLNNFVHLIGISTGPYILFAGKPAHSQSRMTAVIRFNDGHEPILYNPRSWAETGYVRREIDYWWDTYLYYTFNNRGDNSPPFYAALSVHLAERFANGSIDRQYNDIMIEPDNKIESVSIQIHRRQGSDLPAPPGWGLFASIPREWTYESECRFVFTPDRVQLDDREFHMDIDVLWDGEDLDNGCDAKYNPADEPLHRRGQYGDPSGSDDDAYDDRENGNEEEEEDDEDNQGLIDEKETGGDGSDWENEFQYGERQYIPPNDGNDDGEENRDNVDGSDWGNEAQYGERQYIPPNDGQYIPPNNGNDDGEENRYNVDGSDWGNEAQYGERQYIPPNDGNDDGEENRDNVDGSDWGNEAQYGERQYIPPNDGNDDGMNSENVIVTEEDDGEEVGEALKGEGQYRRYGNEEYEEENRGYGANGEEFGGRVRGGLSGDVGEGEGSGDEGGEGTPPVEGPGREDEDGDDGGYAVRDKSGGSEAETRRRLRMQS